MHYLKAVQAANTKDAKPVMAKMKDMPINDFMTTNEKLRKDTVTKLLRDEVNAKKLGKPPPIGKVFQSLPK